MADQSTEARLREALIDISVFENMPDGHPLGLSDHHLVMRFVKAQRFLRRFDWQDNVPSLLDELTRLRAEVEEAFEAIDQALDDMGENGLSVCPAAKRQLAEAHAKLARTTLNGERADTGMPAHLRNQRPAATSQRRTS